VTCALFETFYTPDMGILKVEPVGLDELGTRIESYAVAVEAMSPPGLNGLLCQATASAVDSVHSAAVTVEATMSAWLRSTAVKLATAGNEYTCGDEESAIRLRGLIVGH
jgi:hypothetical protein